MGLERVRYHLLTCDGDVCRARTEARATREALRDLVKALRWHATEYLDGGVFALCPACIEGKEEGWHRQRPVQRKGHRRSAVRVMG